MWNPLVAKRSHEDHPAVSTVVSSTLLAILIKLVDASALSRRPNEEYAYQVLFDTISPRSALSPLGILVNDSRISTSHHPHEHLTGGIWSVHK